MEKRQRRIYTRSSRSLMLVVVCGWAVLGFGGPVLVSELMNARWLEAVTGYFALAIGVPVAMMALVFWFCARQEDLDRKSGVSDHY